MIRVPKGKKEEPLEILWNDACSISSWGSPEKHGGLLSVMTIGYLLHEDKESICMVQNISEDKGVSCSMTIPRECITSMRRFRRK